MKHLCCYSGLFAKLVMMRWFDPRQMVILGGFLSATGMVIMSLSPQFSVLYFGAILAGWYWILVFAVFQQFLKCTHTI